MTLSHEISRIFTDHFCVLILDNEVTLDAFVAENPLPWARLVTTDGIYRIGEEYPTRLTAEEASREELNWDRVSDVAIAEAVRGLDSTIGLVAFGNNAAQGLPLALALPQALRGPRGVVIYGRTLPERTTYETAGYQRFCPRDGLLPLIAEAAAATGRSPAIAFINTIEHNQQNYHAPWPGRS